MAYNLPLKKIKTKLQMPILHGLIIYQTKYLIVLTGSRIKDQSMLGKSVEY